MCGVRDFGEGATRRARTLYLGDDLYLRGGSQRDTSILSGGSSESCLFYVCERTCFRATLGVLDCAGREVGEHH